MSSAKQNYAIARLIVGAMSIDGSFDKQESEQVASTLNSIGMGELIADVGSVIEEGDYDCINLFEECREIKESLGPDGGDSAILIFRVISDVLASDRFVSEREAAYLSAIARKLGLEAPIARKIFKQVMAERRGRLEISGSEIDETINPHLKDLLSFEGSEGLVGELDSDSLEEMVQMATQSMAEGEAISHDDFARAMTILGLESNAKLEDAEEVWKETISNLNLPRMADLGETFVSAAIQRITKVNEAYKTILHFHQKASALL